MTTFTETPIFIEDWVFIFLLSKILYTKVVYTVNKTTFGKYQVVELKNKNTNEYLSVIPDFGGKIHKTALLTKKGLKSITDFDKDVKELTENKLYKNCLLVPFANRIRGGEYTFRNERYNLHINFPKQDHSIHGLVYNKPFSVAKIQVKDKSSSITLSYISQGDEPGYPFKYITSITYSLSPQKIDFEVRVRNSDNKPIPLSVGYHPYFCLGNRVDDLMLRLPVKWRMVTDEKQIPTGRKELYFQYNKLSPIGSLHIDDCFTIGEINEERAVTTIYNPSDKTEIGLWQETGRNLFNYLQVYIPPHRRSIAIEPMTGNIDSFNNHKGLILLKPNSDFRGRFGIFVK